jgi:subtilisin family serine protease
MPKLARRAMPRKPIIPTLKGPGFVGGSFVSPEFPDSPDIPDYVVAELRSDIPIAFSASGFSAPAVGENQATALNTVLRRFGIASIASLFGLNDTVLARRVDIAVSLSTAPSSRALAAREADFSFRQSSFVQIVPKNPSDSRNLAAALERSRLVVQAHVAPRPVPAGLSGSAIGTRLFEPAQGYLYSAPAGIGATDAWHLAGAKGKNITICDIEGAWNTAHEDLPEGIQLIGGTMIPDIGWRNHGTAVLGEMVSVPNSKGCVGISHEVTAKVHSAVIDGVFNVPRAITNAGSQLTKGDVILIELQATGPTNNYVAMQFWDEIFLAIATVTAQGITVVEAAGNGNVNFDLPIFKNTGLQKDSGAIVVGAGIPPANFFDFDGSGGFGPAYSNIGVPRSRIWFSNYGKIVNLQGWGFHVATLAYGDLQGSASENEWYTLRFSGTSSASPIVTGTVACLQGRAKAKLGGPLTPARVRNILVATGTRQEPGPGVPVSQHIGPLPNLAKAMSRV